MKILLKFSKLKICNKYQDALFFKCMKRKKTNHKQNKQESNLTHRTILSFVVYFYLHILENMNKLHTCISLLFRTTWQLLHFFCLNILSLSKRLQTCNCGPPTMLTIQFCSNLNSNLYKDNNRMEKNASMLDSSKRLNLT